MHGMGITKTCAAGAAVVALAVAALGSASAEAGADVRAAPAPALYPPEPVDDFEGYALDATSILLCWSTDMGEEIDSWTLTMAPGTAPPPPDAPSVEVRGGAITVCHRVSGLLTDAPYTFALVGHNAAGDGPRETHTAAARVPGTFVQGTWGTRLLPHSREYGKATVAVVRRSGRVHVAYLGSVPGTRRTGLYHTTRSPAGRWAAPELITRHQLTSADPLITVNDRGAVAIGWNAVVHTLVAEVRVREAGARSWKPTRRLGRDHLDALALDRSGHLHALLASYGSFSPEGLHYLANAAVAGGSGGCPARRAGPSCSGAGNPTNAAACS